MEIIACIRSDYGEKFGIPRQSGLAGSSREKIVFEKPYRNPDCIRGIEGFSHLWLLWEFSAIPKGAFSATVRPPRLGGNERRGVFATRSPFRPNRIGLSCVRLVAVDREDPEGPCLIVAGSDLMDGTPIVDIKPYLPYADAHPEAIGGFADDQSTKLQVSVDEAILNRFDKEKRQALIEVLAQDPRPSYQEDPERIYGMLFAGKNIRFRVNGNTLIVLSADDAD